MYKRPIYLLNIKETYSFLNKAKRDVCICKGLPRAMIFLISLNRSLLIFFKTYTLMDKGMARAMIFFRNRSIFFFFEIDLASLIACFKTFCLKK